MGLFDRLKKKETSEQKQEEEKNYLEYRFPYFGHLSDGTEYTVLNFEVKQRFTHRDGRITLAVMAEIINAGIDDRFMSNKTSYISFEIEPNQPVTREMCQRLIEGYSIAKGQNGKYHTFLGKLIREPSGEIDHEPGSATVAKYMDDIARELLQQRNIKSRKETEEFHQQIQEQYQSKLNGAQENDEKAETLEEKAIQERLEHPYFVSVRHNPDVEEYNGINLETGKIMRFRNVHKILKEDGTYLYTAFRMDVQHDTDAEMSPEEYGYPITFETDFRLEDIPELPDKDMMLQMLTLLGIDEKKLKKTDLTYIGKLDRKGTLTRDSVSRSKFMNEKIKELKDSFRRKMDAKFER